MWRKILLVAGIIAFGSSAAPAFIGNIKVGGFKVPCAVACGGDRGIINPNFAGDFVNNVFLGPSIDNFEGSANRSVDRAIQQLDGTLTKQRTALLSELEKLTKDQRDQLISQLTDLSNETIASLDDKLRVQLREADNLIENRLGTLDALLSRQSNDFTYSFRRMAIFSVILIGVGVLGWRAYTHIFDAKRTPQTFAPQLVWGLLAITIFSGAAYAITAVNQRFAEAQITKYYEDGYRTSLSNLNLDHAVYYSTQILFLDRKSTGAQAKATKASILRDIFARPALYRTEDGARELGFRLSAAQRNFVQSNLGPDPDLTMAYGFLTWQRGPDRFSEYVAAVALASALEAAREAKGNDVWLMKPFALYYLNSYLENPLSDEIVSELYNRYGAKYDQDFLSAKDADRSAPGQISLLKKRYTNAELRSVLGSNQINIDDIARKIPLYAYIRTNMEAVKTSKIVVSRYTHLLRLTGLLQISSPDDKTAIRSEIRANALEIVANWEAYQDFLVSNEFSDPSAKLNSLRSIWPIYTRSMNASKLAENADAWGAGDPNLGVHKRWLSDVVRPSVRASAYRLIAITTESDFQSVDAKLDAVEKSIKIFFDARVKLEAADKAPDAAARSAAGGALRTAALDVAAKGTALGLYGCRQQGRANWDCKGDDSLPTSFAQLIFEEAKGVTPSVTGSGEVFTNLVAQRTTPAL